MMLTETSPTTLSAPAVLIDKIERLKQRYQIRPEPQLARHIATLLRTLCRHSGFRPGHANWCRLYRLTVYWECLALKDPE